MARTVVSKHADAVNEAPFKGTHYSMWESTQLRLSGAIIGVIAAASARPNKESRQTALKWVERSSE
jgi:hypothetical protein